MFGGRSTAARTRRIIELMDMGFERAPSNARVRSPQAPAPMVSERVSGTSAATPGGAGKTIRVSGVVRTSLRPQTRPVATIADADLAVDTDVINSALAEALGTALNDVSASQDDNLSALAAVQTAQAPQPRPAAVMSTVTLPQDNAATPEIVTRVSTSGGRHWGVNVGRYNSRHDAERVLLKVALNEMTTLNGALRRVTPRAGHYDANFLGMTREGAGLACRRLHARSTPCTIIGSD
jgi:D-alanyl-D-alanine carboxypeptidase